MDNSTKFHDDKLKRLDKSKEDAQKEIRWQIFDILVEYIGKFTGNGTSLKSIADFFNDIDKDTINNWINRKTGISPRLRSRIYNDVEKIGKEALPALQELYVRNRNLKQNSITISKIRTFSTAKELIMYLMEEYQEEASKSDDWLDSFSKKTKEIKILLVEKIKLDLKKNNFYSIEANYCYGSKLISDDYCFTLHFAMPNKKKYKVAVILNSNGIDLNTWASQSFSTFFDRGAKMILAFTTNRVSQTVKNDFMCQNIYINEIPVNVLDMVKVSSKFIYNDVIKQEDLINLNKLSDFMLYGIYNSFDTVLKNIIYLNKKKEPRMKNIQDGMLSRHKSSYEIEADFENRLIADVLRKRTFGKKVNKVVGINYTSFPPLYRNRELFEDITLFDSSNEFVTFARSMLEQENEQGTLGDVKFTVRSFKLNVVDSINQNSELTDKVDLVILGIGAGSFVKNLNTYLTHINTWLKDGGYLFISVYNTEAISSPLQQKISSDRLEFSVEKNKLLAQYKIEPEENADIVYRIYCRTYSVQEICSALLRCFTVLPEYIHTYPSLALILDENIDGQMHKHFLEMEASYSLEKRRAFTQGYYITLFVQKQSSSQELRWRKYEEAKKRIQCYRNGLMELTHTPVLNRTRQCKVLEKEGAELNREYSNIVKTLLLKEYNSDSSQIYCVLLEANKVLKPCEREDIYKLPEIDEKLSLLTVKEINDKGFEIGNLCPFSEYPNCKYYFDKSIRDINANIFFFGSCMSDKTFKLPKKEFMFLLETYGYKETVLDTKPYNYF